MAKAKRPSDYALMAAAAKSNDIVSYRPVNFLYVRDVFYEKFKKEFLQPKAVLYVATRDHHNANDGFNFNKGDTICLKNEGNTIVFTGTMPWTSKDLKGDAAEGADYGSVKRLVKEGRVPINVVVKKERADWTAEDVCEYIIKQECLKKKCFYSDLMREENPKLVSNQDFGTDVTIPTFVSYARSMKFTDYLNSIENFFVNSKVQLDAVFIWTDLFCANQPILTGEVKYEGKDNKYDLLTGGLYNAIAKFKQKLILFDSWNKPRPLQRAWCIWEIYAVARSGTEIKITMTEEQRNLYLEALQDAHKFDEIMQSIIDLDAVRATCFNEADLTMIHDAIKRFSSFPKVNDTILEQLRQWHITTALAYVKEKQKVVGASETTEFATLLNSTGILLQSRGKYEEAESFLRRALTIVTKSLGDEHPRVANFRNNLALLLKEQGKLEEAKPLYEESLRIRRNALGNDHPDVAQSLNNIALLLKQQGQNDEALKLFYEALRIWEGAYGKVHPKYALQLNNIATLLRDMGQNDKALKLFYEALQIREKVHGKEHPKYALQLNNIAIILSAMGRFDEALEIKKEELAIERKVFGKNHPQYASSLNNLALLLREMGNKDEALKFHYAALHIDEYVLGKDHPSYAVDLNNIAQLLRHQGRLEEAEPLYRECIEISKKRLGAEHPNVATMLYNLASLLKKLGKRGEAKKLGVEAFKIALKVYGPEHPDTKTYQYYDRFEP